MRNLVAPNERGFSDERPSEGGYRFVDAWRPIWIEIQRVPTESTAVVAGLPSPLTYLEEWLTRRNRSGNQQASPSVPVVYTAMR